MNSTIIYVLQRLSHKETIKIGHTSDIINRIGNYRDVLFSSCFLFDIIIRFYTLIYF